MAQMEHPKMAKILAALSNDASHELFKIVAAGKISTYDLKTQMKLTKKQYYSRLHRLIQSGLIRRKDSLYCLTTFGKIFYDSQIVVENALDNFWKMKAMDSLELAEGIHPDERKELLETLMKNNDVKAILSGT
jgi:predicted transcriptional regulator